MPSKEILLALMAYGQHGHGPAIFDFKQGDISIRAKADNQLPQKGMLRRCLATTEWKAA